MKWVILIMIFLNLKQRINHLIKENSLKKISIKAKVNNNVIHTEKSKPNIYWYLLVYFVP